MSWTKYYSDFLYVIYDRSEVPLPGAFRVMPNIGSDIYDKLTYMIDNYDDLPEVGIYIKANLFKYITKEEFDLVKDNNTFTPLLTQHHKTYMPVCFYKDGLYHEINNKWYLAQHPANRPQELLDFLKLDEEYVAFAPGSNYIIPRENILKHPKEFYVKLRSFLEWDRYPGEAQIIERALYKIFK
jgi:hypothetical protein